jgi:hypothetical protein
MCGYVDEHLAKLKELIAENEGRERNRDLDGMVCATQRY